MEEGEFRFSWRRLPVGEVGEYGLGAPPVMVELLSRMLSRGRAWSALVGVVLDRGEGERGERARPLRWCVGDEGERELGEEERTGRSFAVYVQVNDQQNKVFINRQKG